MTNYKVTHASGGRCEFDIDGPSSAYRDRTGHVAVWGLSKIYQDTATICIENGFLSCTRDLVEGYNTRLFLVSEKCVMSPRFHSTFSWDGNLQRYHVKYTLSSVTDNTVGNLREFSDPTTGEWYLKSEIKLVAVDWGTRRSTKLPKHFYEMLKENVDKEQTPMILGRQKVFVPPERAFQTSIQTRYSDIDFNLHLNNAEYYKFCSETETKASIFGYYRYFTSDIVHYPVLETEASFLGECGPAEHLVVYTWQDEKDFTKLHFVICRKEVRIFQCTFIHDRQMFQDKILSSL